MKSIITFFQSLLESMARARAATALARMGKYDEATRLYK